MTRHKECVPVSWFAHPFLEIAEKSQE